MRDIMGMMQKAKELQDKMGQVQEDLQKLEVVGSAGAGMVSITLNGKGDMRAIKVDPSLVADGDVEIIEDLILAAHTDARAKSEALAAEKMQEMTAGMPLPPGMKLPF